MMASSMMDFPAVHPLNGQDCQECSLCAVLCPGCWSGHWYCKGDMIVCIMVQLQCNVDACSEHVIVILLLLHGSEALRPKSLVATHYHLWFLEWSLTITSGHPHTFSHVPYTQANAYKTRDTNVFQKIINIYDLISTLEFIKAWKCIRLKVQYVVLG